MIFAYLGKVAIYSATFFALLTAVAYLLSFKRPDSSSPWGRRFFILSGLSIGLAVVSLLYLILTHNFAVSYVYNYSSSDLPLYYLISTFWAGQEGTFLLWIFFTSILGFILLKRSGPFEAGNFFFISLFFLSILLILIKRSPFGMAAEIPRQGAGLNPLLQNYWMTIHPVVMFSGFSAAVIPFAFALSALIKRQYDSWVAYVFPWAILSFITLGTALVMGGFWAYEVLGWGGYWAWDPVENSALIPWLFSAGLIHTLIIHKKKNALKRTGFALAILAFFSVVYGTFLTRSGVLGDFSVHSFLNLGINSYLIGSLVLFGGVSAVIFAWRFKEIKGEPSADDWLSREFLVFGNILGMILAGFLVAMGMSSPLLTRAFGTPASVQTAYYNISITPVAIIVTFLLALMPAVTWGRNSKKEFWKFLRVPLAISVILTLFISLAMVRKPLFILFIFLSVFAILSNGKIVWQRLKAGKVASAFIGHAGIALLFIGVIFSNVYERRARLNLLPGEAEAALGYSFTYQGKDSNSPEGKTPHKILVQKGSHSFVAAPRQYFSAYSQGVMRTPFIKRYWNRDLYIAPVDEFDQSISEQGFSLLQGQETEIKGYKIRLKELDSKPLAGGEEFRAVLEIDNGKEKEEVIPHITREGENFIPHNASFNHDRALVVIDDLKPAEGEVLLRIIGQSANSTEIPVTGFAIEVSVKPFINLFWGGAILVVLSGIASFVKRWKRVYAQPKQTQPKLEEKQGAEKVPAQL